MGYDSSPSAWKSDARAACAVCSSAKGSSLVRLLNNSPHEDTLAAARKWQGRSHRHGQGLESYLKEDHDALNKEWQRRLDFISSKLQKFPCDNLFPCAANCEPCPHMHIKWDSTRIALTPREATTALRGGKPSIVLSSGEHGEACR